MLNLADESATGQDGSDTPEEEDALPKFERQITDSYWSANQCRYWCYA